MSWGWWWDYGIEPPGNSLRLAGMGNLMLVIEDEQNEINLYDFGNNVAGIIEDDTGKTRIRGLGMWSEDEKSEWPVRRFWGEAIYRKVGKGAVGGMLDHRSLKDEGTDMWGETVEWRYEDFRYGGFFAFNLDTNLNLGFHYDYEGIKSGYDDEYFDWKKRFHRGGGALSFSKSDSVGKQFNMGVTFDYTDSKEEYRDKENECIEKKIGVQGIYALDNKLKLGIKGELEHIKEEEEEPDLWRYIKLCGQYKIIGEPGDLIIGFQFGYANYILYKSIWQRYFWEGSEFNTNLGLGYFYKERVKFGIEFYRSRTKRKKLKNGDDVDYRHEMHIGCEIDKENFSFRLGYFSHDYYSSNSGIYCLGIGYLLPSDIGKLDIAYNLEKEGPWKSDFWTLGLMATFYPFN